MIKKDPPTYDSSILNPNIDSNKTLVDSDSKVRKCPIRKLESFAYVIVFSLFLNVMVTLGVARSLVIYFLPFREYYNLTYKGTASFIAVYMTCGGVAAMIIAKLCRKFGARPICVICSLTGTAAWILASNYVGPNTQYEGGHKYLLIFLAIAGFCHGGVLVNAPVEVNRWWPKTKRSIVNSIVWSGSSFGAIIYPLCYNKCRSLIERKRLEEGNNDDSQDWLKAMFYITLVQGVIMLGTCLTLRDPKYDFAKEEAKSKDDQEVTFKGLFKFKLYKVYILSQVFYGFWRSGTTTWIAAYAEDSKNFKRTEAVMLLTYWATAELITRPIIGRLAKSMNRYKVIAVLFLLQCICTGALPKVEDKGYFTMLVICIGSIQGGAGGLFMTAAIDAVGAVRARYAYSVENTIDIFVAACVVHLYGGMVDRTDEKQWKNPSDKVFVYASVFILISAMISLYGSRLRQFSDENDDEEEEIKGKLDNHEPVMVPKPDRHNGNNNESDLFIINQNCGHGDAPLQLDFSKCPYLQNNCSSAKSLNDFIETHEGRR